MWEDAEADAQKWSRAACVGNVLGRQTERKRKRRQHGLRFPFTLEPHTSVEALITVSMSNCQIDFNPVTHLFIYSISTHQGPVLCPAPCITHFA